MRSRLADWSRRYLPAECGSLVGALGAANLVWWLTQNPVAAAIAGAWGENLAYYGIMLAREVSATTSVRRAVLNLVFEFGVAEAIDTGLVRPAFMYLATRLVADLSLGVFIGKLAADVTFYVPAIAAYELRRRYAPDRRDTTGANASITRSKTIT